MQEFSHLPVLLKETIELLNIKEDGIYVDCTAGGGGHSSAICEHLKTGKLIALDQDMAAIEAAGKRLEKYGDRATLIHTNFENAAEKLREIGIEHIDGALMDLGVSSYQLDTAERGFSYNQDAPLDMRMNREVTLSAYEVVNTYDEKELVRVIFEYGEEKFAKRIAANIVKKREEKPIETTGELADLIKASMPAAAKEGGHHPAKRTFQAIRIEVNRELDVITPAIKGLVDMMNAGGRMAVITFHSLEDRITKQTFQSLYGGCTCPRDFPVCVCGNKPKAKAVTKKPVVSGDEELEVNPRARSAKLRVCEKV